MGGGTSVFDLIEKNSGSSGLASGFLPKTPSIMGEGWSSTLEAHLYVSQSVPAANSSPYWLGWISVSLGDGRYRVFRPTDTGFEALNASSDKLWKIPSSSLNAVENFYVYQPENTDTQYVFGFFDGQLMDPSKGYIGYLYQIKHQGQLIATFFPERIHSESFTRPKRVVGKFGQSLFLDYDLTGRLVKITYLNPLGGLVDFVDYHYDESGRLVRVGYSDGYIQTLHYEFPDNIYLLTGRSINGERIETYRYDNEGRAIESSRAAGADRYFVDYSRWGAGNGVFAGAVVTDPLGNSRVYGYRVSRGKIVLTASNAPPSNHAENPVYQRFVTEGGRLVTEHDFLGNSKSSSFDGNL